MAVAAEVVQKHLNLHHSWKTGREEVLSLCVSREQNILTGHESSMLVWSLDTNCQNASLKESLEPPVKGGVTCICQFPHETALALSVDQSIVLYQYAIVNGLMTSLSLKEQFCFNSEEINQIDIHPKGTFLCACDDNGQITVVDIANKKILCTLSRYHESICSTVKFSIRKPWELVSGGLDCTIGRWDFSRGRLLAKLSTNDNATSDSFMVNPPMVHSLDVFHAHHSIVCGLGDGSLVVYSLNSPKGLDLACQAHAHRSSIACVCCAVIKNKSDSATTDFVVSAGNDKMLCVHKLVYKTGPNGATIRDLLLVGRICDIHKVNEIGISCGDSLLIFTADVTGSVSIYSFK